MDIKQIPVTDNELAHQFEMKVNGQIAKIEYMMSGERMFLTHTEVPVSLEGQGVAAHMVEKVLQIIDERKLKLVPLCPYVASYLRKHPEWKRLLAHGIRI
ncbi:hypothetical protein LX64_02456 [Chitinophaga skermanii]|uniref:N-acetyltransferase domain-containing protein n=1 Tax=Chitinophaga skermanii TaxID=331697 RepID=A0A327QL75_9BACT|nr:GNAT family N-acetyltransferase [Chitinophaga skermanii]RAJ05299.1 hypothetical protein LX64_02456 [Chitinophaga skermanii]